jgi:hypothetical protein
LVEINVGTSSAADLGLIASGQAIPGLDFDLTGRLIAFANSGNAYVIPNFLTSGTGEFLSNTGVPMAGATTLPAPSAVPEPSTVVSLALGCVFLLLCRRRGRVAKTKSSRPGPVGEAGA